MVMDLSQFTLGQKEKPKQINIPVYNETADKVSEMREYNVSVNKAVEELINKELYTSFLQAKAEGKIKVKAKQ